MKSSGKALIIAIFINFMAFMATSAMAELNPSYTTIRGYEGTLFEFADGSNDYVLDYESAPGQLPSGESVEVGDTGFEFTDLFSSSINWLLESSGLVYVFDMLIGVHTLITMMGLPIIIIFAIDTLWYGSVLYFLVSWALSKE